MFFNKKITEQLVNSQFQNEQLKKENTDLLKSIEALKSQLAQDSEKSDKIQDLELQIKNLNNELLIINEKPEVNNDVGLSDLFKFQNDNLKKSLLDIQGDISQSTDLSRAALKQTFPIDKAYQTSKKELNEIVQNINNLASSSNISVITLDILKI